MLGLLAEVKVGPCWIQTILLGKAKTPVMWDFTSACNKCFLKGLYSGFFFSPFCVVFFIFFFCLLSVGHCLEGPGLANSNEQAFCLLVIPVRLFK